MRINTNVSALNAHKNLTQADNRIGGALERLSAGLKTNNAAEPDTLDNLSKVNKIEESRGSVLNTKG